MLLKKHHRKEFPMKLYLEGKVILAKFMLILLMRIIILVGVQNLILTICVRMHGDGNL